MMSGGGSRSPGAIPSLPCPTCGKCVCMPAEHSVRSNPYFPFCSQRCRLVDLNAWLDADYRMVASSDASQEAADGDPDGSLC